jgi:hypothetical protein
MESWLVAAGAKTGGTFVGPQGLHGKSVDDSPTITFKPKTILSRAIFPSCSSDDKCTRTNIRAIAKTRASTNARNPQIHGLSQLQSPPN